MPWLEQLRPAPAPAGMQLVAPAAKVLVKSTPKPRLRPRKGKRPSLPREPVQAPTPVIAQDQNPSGSFVVPLPQPENPVQKTAEPKGARASSDEGAELRAAQLAEAQREQEQEVEPEAAARVARRAEEAARKLAEDEARLATALAEQEKQQEALRVQQINEQTARQRADQMVRQKADELAVKQKAEELALKHKAEELAFKQKAEEFALKQKAEERALKQQAEELALRQNAQALEVRQKAEELALRQRTEELASRPKADELAARQRADELARQQVVEAARQQAEQAARQRAEQATREVDAAAAPSAGSANNGAGGTGITVPKSMVGSDAGNRIRELTRGIDLLSGAPAQRARADEERGARRAVVGAAERDISLRMYAESFRQKIERNGGLAFSPIAGNRVRIEPLVSVALRSDGSVEEVTIVQSTGNTETDNAVRRIVRLNARYSAFPPHIAAKFDVIEVRRIWSFAESLKLLEEVR